MPGKNAAAFRAGGAKLLVRYLGVDERLIDEVRAIQDHHHASGASQGTIGQLFQEQAQQTPIPALPPAPTHRFQFMSPGMTGRDMHEFVCKDVCYLLTFMHDDALHIKFGRTSDAHMREIPGVQLWFMLETPQSKRVEDELKKKMLYRGHLTEVTVKGKKQTEVLKGISPEEAEQILVSMQEACDNGDDDSLQLKLAKIELRKTELETQAMVRKAELELELQTRNNRMQLVKQYLELSAGTSVPPETFMKMLGL